VKALAAAALLLAGAAHADIVSPAPDSVAVAIYHRGQVDTRSLINGRDEWGAFGFVVETRTVNLPAGPSTVQFRGVASTIVPESARIDGLPGGGGERNFDYDLLSPGSLLEHSVGKTVALVRTDKKTGKESTQTAIVRAASGGAVLEIDGKLEALHCGGPPERLVFDEIPEGLTGTPTLSVRTSVPTAGRYTIRLAYIATKMNWSADYVARVDPDGSTLSLTGWITLANFSDTSFHDVPAQVIAGNPRTTGDDREVQAQASWIAPQCWPLDIDWSTWPLMPPPPPPPMPPPPGVEDVVVTASRIPQVGVYSSSPMTAVVENFGDYKLYTVPVRTEIASHQTKQVAFLDQHNVKFEKVYIYGVPVDWGSDSVHHPEPAGVCYRLHNTDEAGLGKPMPGGTLSVIDGDGRGGSAFVGQARLLDTPVGLPVLIGTGGALAVHVFPRIAARETSGKGKDARKRDKVEVEVTNDMGKPAAFEFSLSSGPDGTRLVDEDTAHILNDEGKTTWKLTLAAGERRIFHYTVDYPSGG
jgi:hypothetical protein